LTAVRANGRSPLRRNAMNRVITLTTDFGNRDPFVGQMKGVILTISPHAFTVDITHEITPQDIYEAAFVIGSSYRYFPPGAIHIVVVDPGVGSERRPLLMAAGGHFFLGPDNGIFSCVVSSTEFVKAVHITEKKYMLAKDSPTFQGRDVFASAAAWLSGGVIMEQFGPFISDYMTLAIPLPRRNASQIEGEIIYIDRFGNAITNIKKCDLQELGGRFSVEMKGMTLRPVQYYAQSAEKALACLVNSSEQLELFANMGSAAALFGIAKGQQVIVRPV